MKNTSKLDLKKIRLKRSLTQEQVASYLNISRTYYGQIESGDRRPGGKLAVEIADFFGIELRALLKG
jgi:transcriptional regulator with XRE-family HTH domain